jgi:hypothetical protein
MFKTFIFENRAVYEITWKNSVDPGRVHLKIWRMRIACWIPKAKNTLSEYAICFSTAAMVARTQLNTTLQYTASLVLLMMRFNRSSSYSASEHAFRQPVLVFLVFPLKFRVHSLRNKSFKMTVYLYYIQIQSSYRAVNTLFPNDKKESVIIIHETNLPLLWDPFKTYKYRVQVCAGSRISVRETWWCL